MARTDAMQTLLEPVVEAMGYELVCVELIRAKSVLVRLYIDSPQGINLEDCERVSHQVSGVMDVEDPISGEYTLEVSSPGLDRPLVKPEHFVRFAGCAARVQLHSPVDGRRKFKGALLGLDGENVLITDEDQTWQLPLVDIEKARLIADIPELTPKGEKKSRKASD